MRSAMADDAATGGFAERLGARAVSADDGRATVRFDATDEHLNPAGTQVRTRGEHLTVCDADVGQDGKDVVHAVATFALLHD